MDAPSPRFHAIVAAEDESPWLEACLGALTEQTLPPVRITLCVPTPPPWTARFPLVQPLPAPAAGIFTHAAAVNRAAARARDADCLLLLDGETVLAERCLEQLAAALQRELSVGVMGVKVLRADVETIEELGARLAGNGLPEPIHRGQPDRGQFEGTRRVVCAPVKAMAVRAGVWCELGGLDERIGSAFYEKADFCWRALQHHWGVAVACEATATSFGSAFDGTRPPERVRADFRGRVRFLRKHYDASDWLRRFVPAELRWLASRASRGRRWLALRTLLEPVRNGRNPTAERRRC